MLRGLVIPVYAREKWGRKALPTGEGGILARECLGAVAKGYLVLACALHGCGQPERLPEARIGHPPASRAVDPGRPRGLVSAAAPLRLDRPVDLAFPAPGVMLAAERGGRIWRLAAASPEATASLFLDLRDRLDRLGSEDGLRGLALHPSFSTSGVFCIRYQLPFPRRTIVSRFVAQGPDHLTVDPGSEEVLLEIRHGFQRRPGGLAFGPDGYLYLGLGDGGEDVVPAKTAQDRNVLPGKILRIDVGTASLGQAYGIPPGNPYFDPNTRKRGEIFA